MVVTQLPPEVNMLKVSPDRQYFAAYTHNAYEGSGNEYRKTRYLHLNNNATLIPQNQDIGHGEAVGTVNNNDGHLHFEMWEYDVNEQKWHMLNPLHNNINWHVGSPPDVKDPEINNVLLQKQADHPAGTVSGYAFPVQNNAITQYVNSSHTVRPNSWRSGNWKLMPMR